MSDVMLLLGFLVLSLALLGAGLSRYLPSNRKRERQIDAAWRAVARELGGSFHPATPFGMRSIRLGDRGVLVESFEFVCRPPTIVGMRSIVPSWDDVPLGPARRREATDHRIGTRITVDRARTAGDARPAFPVGFGLRSRKSPVVDSGSTLPEPSASRIEVGDGRFDAEVETFGEPASVLAVLDHETRRVCDSLTAGDLSVENDTVRWQTDGVIESSQLLEETVRNLLALVERLRDPGPEIPERLARNAAKDPVAGVRAANLAALQEAFPDEEHTREARRSALDDEAPAVRLAAARCLGAEGVQTLRDLVVVGPPIDARIRSDALRLLVDRTPRETVLPLLDGILDDLPNPEGPRPALGELVLDGAGSQLWLQAAAACGALRHTRATAKLITALGRLDSASSVVVVEALAAIGDPAAEPALIELLGAEETDLAVAAARALGRIGTKAAVEPLLARIDGDGAGSTLGRVGREAIATIQDRLTGAERGQLGLAEAAGARGQLTVAEPSLEGRVSLAKPRQPEGASQTE